MGAVTMEEPVTPTKPTKRRHNWAAIKKCWNAGEAVADISLRHNVGIQQIYQHASEGKWTRRRDMADAEQKPVMPSSAAIARTTETALPQIIAQQHAFVSAEVKRRINAWFDKTLSTADGLHDEIISKVRRIHDVEEIKSLAGSLELVDRVARRTFGLDSPGSQSSGISGLALVAQPWSGSAVIDVTPEPAQLPPALPEAQQTPTIAP